MGYIYLAGHWTVLCSLWMGWNGWLVSLIWPVTARNSIVGVVGLSSPARTLRSSCLTSASHLHLHSPVLSLSLSAVTIWHIITHTFLIPRIGNRTVVMNAHTCDKGVVTADSITSCLSLWHLSDFHKQSARQHTKYIFSALELYTESCWWVQRYNQTFSSCFHLRIANYCQLMNKVWFRFVNEHANAVWTEISISHSDSVQLSEVSLITFRKKDADFFFVIVTVENLI